MDKATALETAKLFKQEVQKEFNPLKIVLFGSYLKGTQNKHSDMDIGVIFDGFKGGFFNASRRLWDIAYGISYDIEPHLLDIQNDKSGFVGHVLANSKVV